MLTTRPLSHVRRVAAILACTTAAVAGVTTVPAAAAQPLSGFNRLTVLCSAASGDFYPGRFGYWRCQEARLDGSGGFAAVRAVCEHAADRRFIATVDYPVTGLGTWVCGPA